MLGVYLRATNRKRLHGDDFDLQRQRFDVQRFDGGEWDHH